MCEAGQDIGRSLQRKGGSGGNTCGCGLTVIGVVGIDLNGSSAFLFLISSIYFCNNLFIHFISSMLEYIWPLGGCLCRRLSLNGRATRLSALVCKAHNDAILTFPQRRSFIVYLTFQFHIWPPEGCPCGGLFLNGRNAVVGACV